MRKRITCKKQRVKGQMSILETNSALSINIKLNIFLYSIQISHTQFVALQIAIGWMSPNELYKRKNFFPADAMFSVIGYRLLNICHVVEFHVLSRLPRRHRV